ncbi:TPA: shufflon system plasmid conjugative transfer pilus tip adhesin PilV [Escherichia coli]|nr:shufflon system plasmid conjugative transfer pilus tip adhesin PilV [Escherichia coli]
MRYISKGFTLIELILVVSVGLAITFLSFQDMLKKYEQIQATSAGEQIKQIGNSVNSYITVHYDKISALNNSAGNTNDPGPRTCDSSISTCSISIQTLINEGLLPSTYSNSNIFNSGYTIVLRRSGAAPYYNVHGLITTNNTWLGANNSIRYDLLGKAMQEAGIDSGLSRDNNTIINGYNGNWVQRSSDFSNINKKGQLAYQVGYGSYSYSIYLRRDGTLPMTGNLNMGSQSINNTKDITASGTIQSGTLRSTGATAVGTTLNVSGLTTLAGANVNGALNANNNLTVAGISTLKGATTLNSTLKVAGTSTLAGTNVNGALNANNTLTVAGATNLRSTLNVAGTSTLAGTNINGVLNANSNLNVAGTSTLRGLLQVNNNINATGNVTSNGQVRGGTVVSNGRATFGEYIQINGIATIGNSCSPNGLQGRNSAGMLLSCVNGKWSSIKPNIEQTSYSSSATNLGVHAYCAISRLGNLEDSHYCRVYRSGNNWYKVEYKGNCEVQCFNFK